MSNGEASQVTAPTRDPDEAALLAILMQSPEAYYDLSTRLSSRLFSCPVHKKILQKVIDNYSNGVLFDTTVIQRDFPDEVGYIYRVRKINTKDRNYNNLYLELDDRRVGRETEVLKERIQNKHGRKALQYMLEAVDKISAIEHNDYVSAMEAAERLLLDAEERMTRYQNGEMNGVSCGMPDIDDFTKGFQFSDLVVLAAPPGGGKTSWALQVAKYVASHQKIPTAIFSMEMSAVQLMQRMASSDLEIYVKKVYQGSLSIEELGRISSWASWVDNSPFYIDEGIGFDIDSISKRIRRLAKTKGVKLFFVDYIQLIKGRGSDKEEKTGNVIRELKNIAKELNVVVVALSQMSRATDLSTKRPALSDLRNSGEIEAAADIVAFIYRPYFHGMIGFEHDQTLAEFLIRKGRSIGTAEIALDFNPDFTKFTNR